MSGSWQPYFVVDTFTDQPFTGNPAAVVPTRPLEGRSLVAERGPGDEPFRKTAFLVPNAGGFDLRWFTPEVEIDLCGHATIAAALVLSQLGKLADESRVDFATRCGVLGARREGSRIRLDFPSLPVAHATRRGCWKRCTCRLVASAGRPSTCWSRSNRQPRCGRLPGLPAAGGGPLPGRDCYGTE